VEFELPTLLVIGTDYTVSCKPNYHTITPTTATKGLTGTKQDNQSRITSPIAAGRDRMGA